MNEVRMSGEVNKSGRFTEQVPWNSCFIEYAAEMDGPYHPAPPQPGDNYARASADRVTWAKPFRISRKSACRADPTVGLLNTR